MKILKPLCICIVLFLLCGTTAEAHAIDYDLSKFSRVDVAWIYLKLGFTHIIPLGFDHILFVLSLFFLTPKLKPVLYQATAFTIAHSITLGLGMYGLISPVSSVIEPIIALSIVFVAIENLLVTDLNKFRLLIVFGFGLVHGLGFASSLSGLGLPRNQFLSSLICFNVGVELGQASIILIAYILIGRWFADKPWYRQRILVPSSIIIAAVAGFWTIQRIFFV